MQAIVALLEQLIMNAIQRTYRNARKLQKRVRLNTLQHVHPTLINVDNQLFKQNQVYND